MRETKMKRSARRCNFIWNEHETKLIAPRSWETEQFPESLLHRSTAACLSAPLVSWQPSQGSHHLAALSRAGSARWGEPQRLRKLGMPPCDHFRASGLWWQLSCDTLEDPGTQSARGCALSGLRILLQKDWPHKSEAQVCRSQTLGGPGNCLHWASAPGD